MTSRSFKLLFVVLGAIYCVPVEEHSKESRYIIYQDEQNVTRVIDLQGPIDPVVLQRALPQDNQYFLYTRSNPDSFQELSATNASSITSSNFDSGKPTVVIAHGWGGNRDDAINPTIRTAYLNKDDVNVIVVDWSWLGNRNYVTAVTGTPAAGRALGQFLSFLSSLTGAKFSDLHLIGFSLGAHLVGNAGRSLPSKAARVTGLDPAGPLWSWNSNRLQKTDAIYVEAIHTDRNLLGTVLNVGHTDFSPNGGFSQPGCTSDGCSHGRSWQYFAATVTFNNLIGRNCENDINLGLNLCFGGSLPMGNDDLRKTGNGIYQVKTTQTYPYA